MAKQNVSQKVTITQLKNILEISYNTAKKEYQVIIDCLQIKRSYLVVKDLIDYGII